jgi:hypothetical protein
MSLDDYKPGSLPGVVGIAVLAILVVAFITILITWPVMALINWLFLPSVLIALFGVAKLGFWQTWALLFICASLFKSTPSTSK